LQTNSLILQNKLALYRKLTNFWYSSHKAGMKKSIILLLHIGGWFCFIFLLLLLIGIYFQGEVPADKLLYYFQILLSLLFIPTVSAFYACYFWLFPKYLRYKKMLLSFVFGGIIAVSAASLGMILLYNTAGSELEFTWTCLALPMLFMTILAFLSEMVALLIKGFLTWFEEIKLKEALQKKNHEMEMALVKAQLDPHFLFNTINNIDVLILKDANEASDYLNKLSDIMRFMLFETKTAAIPLAKELEYIEKYIALQKIRTANNSYVDYAVNGIVNGQTIAPMVFIPFIENAFKHTNNKKLEDAITIDIQIEKERIQMVCKNKFDPHRKNNKDSNGLGNELIQKRLQLIYPERHQLKIDHTNNLYSVSLIINN